SSVKMYSPVTTESPLRSVLCEILSVWASVVVSFVLSSFLSFLHPVKTRAIKLNTIRFFFIVQSIRQSSIKKDLGYVHGASANRAFERNFKKFLGFYRKFHRQFVEYFLS